MSTFSMYPEQCSSIWRYIPLLVSCVSTGLSLVAVLLSVWVLL